MDNWFPCMLLVRKLMLNWIHNIAIIIFSLFFVKLRSWDSIFRHRDSVGSCEMETVHTFVINSPRTPRAESFWLWLTLKLLSVHNDVEMSNISTYSKRKLSVEDFWWEICFKIIEEPRKMKLLKWPSCNLRMMIRSASSPSPQSPHTIRKRFEYNT